MQYIISEENKKDKLLSFQIVYFSLKDWQARFQDDHIKGCKCPRGFKGDGVDHCEGYKIDIKSSAWEALDSDLQLTWFKFEFCLDIDECKEKVACQCSDCKYKNTWGSYECSCRGNQLYIHEHDTCIGKFTFYTSAWKLW